MRLADFILANIEPVLSEWDGFARTIWPGVATVDPATLRDDAEDMLRAAAMDMKSDQDGRQQSDKSKGRGGDGPAGVRVNRASAAHGVGRMSSGFDLAALIAEYRALRASVIRLWRESGPDPDRNDLDDLTRFNESIDQSLTEAVLAYTQRVDRERQAALDEQQKWARELRELNDALLVSSVRQHELTENASRAAAALGEAKEQAEAGSRAKDRFLAVLSHELRTPLTPVMLTVAARELDPALPLPVRDDLKMIRRNVELEVRLIDDLLDLSRITSGKLRLSFDVLDVNDLVGHVCEMCRSHIREKRIDLHCDLDPAAKEVVGDPGRLQQVFWNLLNNAAKFTPEGGQIHVLTQDIDDGIGHVRVTVRDTGIGIAPDVLPRVFDAFEQGDARVTREFGGMGLGLAISKVLVEQHRGSIHAETGGPNKGSTFVVDLPSLCHADEASPGAPAPARADGDNGDVGPLRVLVVEDHADTANVLRRLLSASGHDVKTAHTAAEALALAGRQTFDLVVSDLGLPDMTGYDLMKRIKRDGLKSIAMSGFGMEEDIKRSAQAGFDDHLVKPLSMAQIERAIRRVAPRRT